MVVQRSFASARTSQRQMASLRFLCSQQTAPDRIRTSPIRALVVSAGAPRPGASGMEHATLCAELSLSRVA